MKKRILTLILIVLILFSFTYSVSSQSYSFTLDVETVHVYWEDDGTISLYYEFVFTNEVSAPPIEYVDVSMPNNSYYPSNASAKINGIQIGHIADSTYISNAIELGLGNNSIQPGETGIVTFEITNIDKEIYFDSEDENYASAVFSPQWFGSDVVHGNTDLTVVFHLPPGVFADQGRYHKSPSGFNDEPYTSLDASNRVTYTWNNPTAKGDKQYLFGASFPLSILPEGIIRTPTIWENLGVSPEDLIAFSMVCGFIFLIVGIPVISIISQRRRKLKYLPPMISLSSHGSRSRSPPFS